MKPVASAEPVVETAADPLPPPPIASVVEQETAPLVIDVDIPEAETPIVVGPAAVKAASCKECDLSFDTLQELKTHIAKEHSFVIRRHQAFRVDRKFMCEECGMRFARGTGLRRHVKMVHLNFVHKCPYDVDRFLRRVGSGLCAPRLQVPQGSRRAHLQGAHACSAVSSLICLRWTRYVCDECGKGFVRSNDLRVHRATHDVSKDAIVFECAQ